MLHAPSALIFGAIRRGPRQSFASDKDEVSVREIALAQAEHADAARAVVDIDACEHVIERQVADIVDRADVELDNVHTILEVKDTVVAVVRAELEGVSAPISIQPIITG